MLWSVLTSVPCEFGIQSAPKDKTMNDHTKRPTFTDAEVKRELVNDSLGTIDTADSTGSDETKETGDAKKGNTNGRED